MLIRVPKAARNGMLLSSVVVALSACTQTGLAQSANSQSACDAAKAYILQITDRLSPTVAGVVIKSERLEGYRVYRNARWQTGDGSGATARPAPIALQRRLQALNGENALGRCPSLRKVLTDRGFASGNAAVDAELERRRQGLPAKAIVAISMPSLNEDGSQALFQTTVELGEEGATGDVVQMVRQSDGSWIILAGAVIWVV